MGTQPTPQPIPSFSKGMSVAVVAIGALLVGIGLWNWFDVPTPRATVVRERSLATSQTVTNSVGGSGEEEKHAETTIEDSGGAKSVTETSTKDTTTDGTTVQTQASPTGKKTTTLMPEASRRSEGLTLALVGSGSLLVLAGAFSGRISKVNLPGGGSIELIAGSGGALETLTKATASHDALLTKLSSKLARISIRVKHLEDGDDGRP